ncbi:MAG: protein kinase [Sandaracinus sp.]|nr:protein kinase [Sandaracinus sp.]
MRSVPPPPPPPPQTRFGRYEIVDRIAVGGMAEVFRARETRAVGEPRVVVIKRMLPHVAAEESGLLMFREEARLGAQVAHPNVVELLEVDSADGHPYLALEYVPGCDLWRLSRWLVREGRALGVELSVFVLLELLAGLEAVHEAVDELGHPLGIVHQDVSPSNVLLSVHGDVKLGDFGIAKAAVARALPGVSGRAKGKLGYLAPEQVTGGSATRATDVFAAAVMGAELLIGRPLFAGGSELAILLAIRDANVRPLLDAALPDPLKNALVSALARDPKQRPASAGLLSEKLRAFAPGPQSVLRRELAELVQRATGVEGEAERTPLVDAEPPLAAERTPLTRDLPSQTFEVELSSGRRLGPWRFATVVEAITTGRIGPEDLVSVDGGPMLPVGRDPWLARHLPMATLTPLTRDAALTTEPHVRRNFAGGGFIRAMAESAARRDTGLWLCEQGGVRKEVYVREGVPVFVGSNVAGELLGEHLVTRGVITRGELDSALAVLPRFEGRLGDTLVALELVDAVTLFRAIAEQVREKLLDLFLWESGTAELYRGAVMPAGGFPLDLDAWEILRSGVDRRLDAGLEEARFKGRMLDDLVRVPQLPSFVQEGGLPEELRELFAFAATPRALPELVDALAQPSDARRGYRAVTLALALDLVRWAS